MYQNLLASLENGILTVIINRPEKMNALNKEVMTELGHVVSEIESNPDIKAAIITGSGHLLRVQILVSF